MEAPVPVPATPSDAIAALDADLPKVLRGRALADAGWHRLDPLTLIVPMWGRRPGGGADFFLLKMGFGYYRAFPPSAQFVNPKTLDYRPSEDAAWLPRIEGTNEIQVHPNYHSDCPQLICCSFTLEFYRVRHSVEPQHLWQPATLNFAATLNAIERGLHGYYAGRHA